jgi:hypothetical protein
VLVLVGVPIGCIAVAGALARLLRSDSKQDPFEEKWTWHIK